MSSLAICRAFHQRCSPLGGLSLAHFLLNPSPLSSAYLSMNRMNLFHSAVVFITYVASMPWGLPLEELGVHVHGLELALLVDEVHARDLR